MATTEGLGGVFAVSAAAPATHDDTGFAALTWTDVEKGGDIPQFGASHETVTFTPLKTGVTDKFHGAINYGSFSYEMAYDPADAGQTILREAATPGNATYKDEISGRETRSDGTIRYFRLKVMSYQTGSPVSGVLSASAQIEVTSSTVEA